jgi:hypothetical protein
MKIFARQGKCSLVKGSTIGLGLPLSETSFWAWLGREGDPNNGRL